MIPKPFDSVLKEDLDLLVTNKVPEGRTIDYKRELPGGTDEEKKDLLYDISSFANAAGGDLLFGVSEREGMPDTIEGLASINVDEAKLRLESIIRDGIQPRILGIQMRAIDGFPKGPVLLVRIPRSWVAPHMVAFKKASRFFTRNSAGKYQMDVGELRNAFAVSESLGERMQRFRTDRVSKVVASEMPVEMAQSAKMVLHILPFSPFALTTYIDQRTQQMLRNRLTPMGSSAFYHRHNLDGFITHSGSTITDRANRSYCQFFRSGAIEAVRADVVRDFQGRPMIPSSLCEGYILRVLGPYFAALREIGVPPPVLVALSMTGVKGAELHVGSRSFDNDPAPIDRDVLFLPDIVVEHFDADVAHVARPLFDAIWNAAGYERCYNYDAEGKWSQPRI